MERSKIWRVCAAMTVMVGMAATAAAGVIPHHAKVSGERKRFLLAHKIEDTYTHQWEVAGGGGFLRFEPGTNLRRDNQIDWATSESYFLSQRLSLRADERGHFGDASLPNNIYDVTHPLINEYTLMAGPSWRPWRHENYSLGGFALGGMALGNFDGGTHGIPAANLGLWPTANKAAAAGGVDLDLNLYPNLAFRFEPYVMYTGFGGTSQLNKGLNAQIVFRFGRQKGGLK